MEYKKRRNCVYAVLRMWKQNNQDSGLTKCSDLFSKLEKDISIENNILTSILGPQEQKHVPHPVSQPITEQSSQPGYDLADSDPNKEYDLSKPCPLIIISNTDFQKKPKKIRNGTEADEKAMKKCFQGMNFKCDGLDTSIKLPDNVQKKFNGGIFSNITAEEFDEVLKAVCSHNFEESGGVAFAIFSHGGADDRIQMHDNECIQLNKYVKMVSKIESLVKKPKLFFVQACRGGKMDQGMSCDDDVEDDSDEDAESAFHLDIEIDGNETVPTNQDVYIAYSTIPGHVSYRNRAGSYFIQTLVDVCQKSARENSLDDIMTEVTREVGKKVMKSHKQTVQRVSTLSYKLKFHNLN